MSFNDWRQRLRVVSALGMLDAGLPVQDVARRLGYSTPSAFIAMFQRLTGESPDSARRRSGDAPRASADIAGDPPPRLAARALRTASSTRPMQGTAERATIAPDPNPQATQSHAAPRHQSAGPPGILMSASATPPASLTRFSSAELDMLAKTADALSAFLGKPVLAEVVLGEEGTEW